MPAAAAAHFVHEVAKSCEEEGAETRKRRRSVSACKPQCLILCASVCSPSLDTPEQHLHNVHYKVGTKVQCTGTHTNIVHAAAPPSRAAIERTLQAAALARSLALSLSPPSLLHRLRTAFASAIQEQKSAE